MLSRVERLLKAPSRMDLRIQLDRAQVVYTNEDAVSGQIILRNEAQVDITTISVKLSGYATSRLDSGRVTESHQLFKRVEQVFPPNSGSSWFTSRTVTVGPGEHAFPFSIRFPQVSECYKSSPANVDKRPANKRKLHILRKLPPSTGDSTTPEEIKYLLEATSQNIQFHRISTIRHPLHGLTGSHTVVCNADSNTPDISSQEAHYKIEAKLVNGPFLQLDHPISLEVTIRRLNGQASDVVMHDFQSMLLESTEVRAWGSAESHTRSWIIQTMTNLRLPIVSVYNSQAGSVLSVNDRLWSGYRLPSYLAPTFETCNVTRNYKLVIRFGIEFGGNNTKIVEFQFPAYIISSTFTERPVSSSSHTINSHGGPDVEAEMKM